MYAAGDSTSAKTYGIRPDYYIDEDQQRIDLLDGKADGKIKLADSATSAYAARIYFGLVDSIRNLIDNPEIEEPRRKVMREALYVQMRKINAGTIYKIKHFEEIFRFMQGELNAVLQNKLFLYLTANEIQTFNNFTLIRNESCADSFLIFAATDHPDLVFFHYDFYRNKDYATHVLEEAAKIAPVTVKRYFNAGDPIFEILQKSNDTVVKLILKIKERFTRKSNAFTLIDGIANGDYTMEHADSIGNNPHKFLHEMLKIRAKKHPLGAHSLDEDLNIYALKFIRVLNDMHNEADAKRFASIEKFTGPEIYSLIVYSEEEIFTSTFNGLFSRLMVKMGPVSGYEFLGDMGNNRFRTFVKMCAGFGKLDGFLQTMTPIHQQMLMINFAGGLGDYGDLSQAVEVADAFGSITDSLVLKILRATIKFEYIKQKNEGNQRGMAIYGLLSSLFVDKTLATPDWFAAVSSQYAIPPFDKITNGKLFNRDSVSRWLIYFYDDEDGEESFTTFVKAFNDENWNVVDSGSYVIIKSRTGKAVHIYANKSKFEYDGQEKLEKLFADSAFEPNVMVHRGHSYYAFKTIEKVKENTQIFVLGSCGGYHSISTIIDRSPEVSIISSKQIGTRTVNNPMLKMMADCVRQGKDIEWQSLWEQLDLAVKGNPKTYERFLDYIPPHKNLGAIFIKTYNKMMEQG
jgi:hypothetical protein